MVWLLAFVLGLAWISTAEAACVPYDAVVPPGFGGVPVPRYWHCALESELAAMPVTPGDRAYTVDTKKIFYRIGNDWSQIATGTAAQGDSVPAGMIAFTVSACPSGWSEFTAGQGFMVVIAPASGTIGGTVGSAFTDLQDKGVVPTFAGAALGTHAHTTLGVGSVATHQHLTLAVTKNSATSGNCAATNIAAGTGSTTACKAAAPNLVVTAPAGTATLSASNAPAFTGTASASSANSAGTPAGTISTVTTSNVVPYIQLRACSKD